MSSQSAQPRNERRQRSRLPIHRSQQQSWVPRGSASAGFANAPPSAVSLDLNESGEHLSHGSGMCDVMAGGNTNGSSHDLGGFNNRNRGNTSGFVHGSGVFDVMPRGNVDGPSHGLGASDNRPRGNPNGSRGRRGQQSNYRRDKERSEPELPTNYSVEIVKDSELPQLGHEIQEKLVKGTVECMICYDMVRRSAPIWSCSSCYSIFHLNCIKKWVRAPTSVDLSAEKNQGFNWRCPGCQSVQLTPLKDIRYVCFCGKRTDPPSDLYLTPHSCGEPCGKPLEKEVLGSHVDKEDLCPHVCVLQCHPGPCPPCKSFAPQCFCPCGKKMIVRRCSDRKSALTCGQACGKVLECSRHQCEQVCHVGPCKPCQVVINASCFCKKTSEVILCGDICVTGDVKAEDGVFCCDAECGKMLSCGNHMCGKSCHPGSCGDCDLLPGKVRSCYCGKTSLEVERKTCLDPIPTCTQACSKRLPCGEHHCQAVCHAGDCPPCLVLVTQKCRCGSTSRTVECYKTTTENETFTCEKPCGQKKNCGRHRCSERCCPLSNPNNAHTGDWDPHFCQMACGKKLRCGQHSCESLCHSGHCPPCLETIFTDLSCACGRTSIPPPLPCGTPLPMCQLPCSVPQPCGHPASHICHFGDCPPCSVPVAKECIGGHVVLRNIPCGSKDIRCNKLCGKTRQCGLHACGKTCHPPPCDTVCGTEGGSRASCGQVCGAPRRDCKHTCTAGCHPYCPCPDVRCELPVTITCSCGRLTASVPCGAGGCDSGAITDSVFEASVAQKLAVPLQPVESTGKKIPLGQRKLMCDEECAKLERKRVLADAFDITPPNMEGLHFGDNSAMTEIIGDLYRRDPKWVLAVEDRCRYLVLCKSRGSSTAKCHVFCPMLKENRDAVRLIAERWKLSVNAAGWEPKRFVVVHVTPKSKPPSRVIGAKGTSSLAVPQPLLFDPLVDMDPRLVVSFIDLPREADISSLVLRFGGECELVWLNDKNALAVFNDPARAATALRRLDHGSAYHGASMVLPNVAASATSAPSNPWGGSTALKSNPWKMAVVQESGSKKDSWGEEWSGAASDVQTSVIQDAPVAASNRWSVLNSESVFSFSSSNNATSKDPAKKAELSLGSSSKPIPSSSDTTFRADAGPSDVQLPDVIDDWENACD